MAEQYFIVYVCVCLCVYIYMYIYNGILLSHQKEWTHAICSNMDGAVDDLSNSGNLETEIHISQDITYMWSLKRDTTEYYSAI